MIECQGISKVYGSGHTRVQALAPTDFKARKGEFVAIVGPSGSGKTTFLTLLGHLQSPTTGKIFFKGRETSQLTEKKRARLRLNDLGFILQSSNLIPYLKVNEQLGLMDRLVKKERLDAGQLLAELDLLDQADAYPKDLSGGERQRAAIARALYHQPDLILADEPTASLDTERAKAVVALLAKAAREDGKTVIMITHDTRLLDQVDSVYRMEDGVLTKER